MNQTIESIKSRRSIRNFKEVQIPEEDLQAILEAGLFAPSANNHQFWHFTVLQSKKMMRELNTETKAVLAESDNPFLQRIGNNEDLDIFNGAPTAIVVSGKQADPNTVTECAMASQNIMLAAESLGIASCYIISLSYLFDSEDGAYFAEKLGTPEGYKVYNAILLGYNASDVTPQAAPRKEGCINYIQ